MKAHPLTIQYNKHKPDLYICGSENKRHRGKVHICDENSKTVCGNWGAWFEATGCLYFIDGAVYSSVFCGIDHLELENIEAMKAMYCKKCFETISKTISK